MIHLIMNKYLLIFPFFFLSFSVLANPGLISKTELRTRAGSFERGLGVEQNFTKAYRLYCLAALQNDPIASYSIGWMYYHGRGRERNINTALGWFHRSAELGSKHGNQMIKRFPSIIAKVDKNCPIFTRGMEVDKSHIRVWVELISPEFNIDPRLVLNVIKVESNFNHTALSNMNAQGLMQLIPKTAVRFGVNDVWNPVENILGGVAYLNWLMNHFDSKLPLVLAAYNAGESAVEKYQNVPPYMETKDYVRRIMQNYLKSNSAITRS